LSSNGLTSAHDQLKEWAQGDLTCEQWRNGVRFTKKNRQQVLDQNEGFKTETSYSGQNFRETRVYEVKDGGLNVRSKSKTSWADSRRTDTYRCSADSEETKRFLRNNRDDLDTDGIE
jgi:intein-encoded DNA endonuclease-like protein